MIGDLHVHTRRSDGSYTPREAVLLAKERGLGYIGIVDHDTTGGLEEAAALGLRVGITVVPGVEISAYDFKRGRKAHLLGFRFRSPALAIDRLCGPILAARDAMTRKHVGTLQDAGYPIATEEVIAFAGADAALYKQHVMAVLVRKGLADGIYGERYRELFKEGGICSEDIRYADVFEALRAIRADGGIAVLAHPGLYDSWELLEELLAEGLDGMELYHESHALEDHRRVLALARAWPGLVLTGGSDDHGSLGSVNTIGDIRAPHGAFEALAGLPTQAYRFVECLVREAGAKLRSALAETALAGAVEFCVKGGDRRDLVTHYDSLIQEYLVTGIAARLQGHGFLCEEGTDLPQPDRPVWIIDPIDGTTNFACTGRDFAISLALYSGGTPEYGIVYDVMADEMYVGMPGAGAYLNGARLGCAGRAVSMGDAVVDISMDSCRVTRDLMGAKPETLALAGRGHRAIGCASLAICRIARGSLDVYVSGKVAAWDYAAADIMLAEAGGASTMRPLPGEGSGPRARGFYAAAASEELLRGAVEALFGASATADKR